MKKNNIKFIYEEEFNIVDKKLTTKNIKNILNRKYFLLRKKFDNKRIN